jgi:RNA polymerase sigma factor (sigma-70 family)
MPATTLDRDPAELFTAARAGDPIALDALITEVLPMVRRAAWRYASTAADVDDIVQEAVAALLAHLDDVHSPDAVEGWLWRVTVNRAHTIARSHRRTVSVAEPRDATASVAASEGLEEPLVRAIVHRERQAAVQDALARLDPDARRLLSLLAEDTNTYADVSRIVGCPIGSIGPARQRVIERLRADPAVRRLRNDR